ncbi:hypothetical protein X907_0286 [Glycocaulis alkaliphilus]|uniref:Uncharacterized protein n=1 Tax=Glycocaulis alkaliphilus TaxID=1434191 RepID=A0A3T0E627_9PROT|nr:hypothetical protein [Glycocaulis alkaliphilus]AZU02834.1 hypothetical protein X907_0286 [Glycocaulis alkaliphilus]GGB84947.1 hypothetical protein GCM10007417_26200 [Glycocaulis alkaliphilus]
MPVSKLPLAIRLHRYGFLLTADLAAAGIVLGRLLADTPANDPDAQLTSTERELFRQFTSRLQHASPVANTNLRSFPASAPASPASFAAALWGLPFTARASLILVCVEGFSLAETAFILDLPLHRAEQSMLSGLFTLQPGTE